MIEANLPIFIPMVFFFAAMLTPLAELANKKFPYFITLGASTLAFLVSIRGLEWVLSHGRWSYHLAGWPPPIGIEYVLDPLSAFFAVLVTGVALPVFIFGQNQVKRDLPIKGGLYYSVCMLFLTGLTGMIITGDLFNLYVFLEIASLSGYALVAVGEKRSSVAAFRYLLLGTIGATMYLLGLGFLFTVTGSLNMADNAKILPFVSGNPAIVVGLSLIVLGVGVKMALFPLHGWLPDAYTFAFPPSTVLLAPIGTKVAAYVLIRVLYFVFEPRFVDVVLPLTDIVLWVSVAGIVVGSVMAITQKELKRMLAYSSVAQIGYIGLGIGLASPLGLVGAILHVLNHACMKASLFMVAGNLETKLGHSIIPEFDPLLRHTMPWTAAAFVVGSLSMIGIPPLAGFFSKWYLVLAAVEKSAWVLVVVILASSLLTAVYFFRVIERMYLRPAVVAHGTVIQQREATVSMVFPTVSFSVALMVLGLFNSFIVSHILMRALPQGW